MPNLVFKIETDSAGAISGVKAYETAIGSLGTKSEEESRRATTAFDRLEKVIGKMRSAIIGFVAAVAFAKLISGLRDVINAGIEFEATFANVRKTVDGTAGQFEILSQQFRQLAKEIPIGITEINRIGEIGGQVGIPIEQLKEYTETVAKLGIATRIPVEEAATSLARLGNIIPIGNIKTFASVITDLDARFPATTREILDFSLNLAGAGAKVGLTSTQVAALATALASVGLHSEKAGSAMTRIFSEMSSAVAQNNDKLKLFAQVALGASGSAREFAEQFKTNAGTALLSFLGGLKAVNESGQSVDLVLKNLGLTNVRIADVAVRGALAVDTYRDAMRSAGIEAGRFGKSLDNRVAIPLGTTEAKLELAQARIHDVSISISNELKPSLADTADLLATLAEKTRNNSEAIKSLALAIATAAAGYAAFRLSTIIGSLYLLEAALAANIVGVTGLEIALGTLQKAALLLMASPLFSISVLTALGGSVLYLTDSWLKYNDAVINSQQAENIRWNSAMRAVSALKDLGITIDTNSKSIQQIEQEIVHHGKSLSAVGQETKKWFDAATALVDAHKKNLKLLTDEQNAFNEKVKEGVNRIDDAAKADKVWLAVMRQAFLQHKDASKVINEYGNEIEKYAKKQRDAGGAIADYIAPFLGYLEKKELEIKLTKELNKYLEDQEELFLKLDAAAERAVKRGLEFRRDISSIQITNPNTPQLPPAGTTLSTTIYGPETPLEVILKNEQEIIDTGQKAINHIASGFNKLFLDLIVHSKSFWDAFKNMGQIIIASVANTFLQTIIHSFLDPFAKSLGDTLRKLSGWLSSHTGGVGTLTGGLFGGAAGAKGTGGFGTFLGAAGGTLAGVTGGALVTAGALGVSGGIGFAAGMGALIAATGPLIPIAAAAAAAMLILSRSIGNTHLKANEFVQKFENPFGQAIAQVIDANNKLIKAGEQTVEGATEARNTVLTLWADFQTAANEFGLRGADQARVVAQMYEHMRPLMSRVLKDMQTGVTDVTLAVAKMADTEAIQKYIDRVDSAVDGFQHLEAALGTLEEMGTSSAVILDTLGSDIEKFARSLELAGIPIPPLIEKYNNLTAALREQERAIKDLQSVEKDLADLRNDLIAAINRQLDENETAIEQSIGKIADWKKKIVSLNLDITEMSAKLADAKFWQKEYKNAIAESERAYEDAVKSRKASEERIEDLTRSIERDRLQSAVDATGYILDLEKDGQQILRAAKEKELENAIKINDRDTRLSLEVRAEKHKILEQQLQDFKDNKDEVLKNEAAYRTAKAALDAFDRAERTRQQQEKIAELEAIKVQLKEQILLETERRLLLVDAKKAADELIIREKKKITDSIANMQAEAEQLKTNITLELLRIDAVQKENYALGQLLETAGGTRTNTDIWATIGSLIARGQALERERDELSLLTGIAAKTPNVFHELGDAISSLASVAEAAAAKIRVAAGESARTTTGGTGTAGTTGGGGQTLNPAQIINGVILGINRYDLPLGSLLPAAVQAQINELFSDRPPFARPTIVTPEVLQRLKDSGLKTYEHGIDYVPNTGPALLHRGERVISANENHWSNAATFNFSVNIAQKPGQDGRTLAKEFVKELELNGDLRRKMRNLAGVNK